jgi:hypothetical protein
MKLTETAILKVQNKIEPQAIVGTEMTIAP